MIAVGRGFAHRALEIHSSRMWQWRQVQQALDFMTKFGMNALVFHQNDIVDHLVFPEKFFPPELMWKRNPVRLHSVHQNRHYINKVVREAKRGGIGFYVEIKEIWFVEQLLELIPQVRNAAGTVCPTHPFWWELLEVKMRELVHVVPDLAGVIVSPGTRESKVSIAANACGCDRCKATDATEWYTHLLTAMHRPLVEAGKTFAVRDFSYSADTQSRMLDAARATSIATSADVVISLKNTPHDYYPTFPDNPRIGHTGGMRQWIEYDTWGQFFGLGFFPVSVVEDMQVRMRHALASGAEGIALRTDWEVITDSGAFNSPNVLNVIAGAMLARDVDRDLDEIYDAWAKHGFYSPMHPASDVQPLVVPTGSEAASRLREFMQASWSVMEGSAYVRGHLFHEDDQYPRTVANAFDMLIEIHGRDDWEPGASKLLDPTDANLAIIHQEKDSALSSVHGLHDILQPATLGVPDATVAELETMLELYALWVEGFALCADAVFAVARSRRDAPGNGGALGSATTTLATSLDAARAAVTPLRDFGARVRAHLDGTSYPHYVYWLLDTTRTDDLANDVETQITKLLPPSEAGSAHGGP